MIITVKFGEYNYFDKTRKDPIKWQILDKKDGRYLLLSKYSLAEMPFHDIQQGGATWETSAEYRETASPPKNTCLTTDTVRLFCQVSAI